MSKTVGRRVLGECIAFSSFGCRPATGDAPREKEKEIRRGRAIEEKEGRNEYFVLLLYKYQRKLRACFDPLEYLISFYRACLIFILLLFFFSFSLLSPRVASS